MRLASSAGSMNNCLRLDVESVLQHKEREEFGLDIREDHGLYSSQREREGLLFLSYSCQSGRMKWASEGQGF